MRAFKRAFARRRRHDPAAPGPADGPVGRGVPPRDPGPAHKDRPSRPRLRLPTLVGAMSFPSRRSSPSQRRGTGRVSRTDDSLATSDLGNSALSLPLADLSVVAARDEIDAPAAPAPIFYDMYDDPPAHRTADDDDPSAPDDVVNPRHASDGFVPEPEEIDDPDTVSLDIATPPSRILPSHRRLIVDRYYRATLPSSRSARKRVATAQAMLLRRQLQEASKTGDHRPPDTSLDDQRQQDRERDREHHRDMEFDYRDLSRYHSDDDYSRLIPEEDPALVGDTKPEEQSCSQSLHRKKANSHSEALPTRKARKEHARAPQKYHAIEESPYHLQPTAQSLPASSSVESRVYEAYNESIKKNARTQSSAGLRTIVDLLRDSEGNPVVIEKAALVIGILSEKDEASRDTFGQHSAVQTLIQCLSMRISAKFDRTLLVKTVTYALASLLRDAPRNLRLFEMFDGPYKMGKAAASERYENVPEIPRNALRALSELKYHPHSTEGVTNHVLTNSSTTSRTIMYVLRAMNLHEYRREIQESGLDALRTLLARAGRGTINSGLLRQSSQTVATAFKLHRESHEIQWQCLTLFCDLDAMREDMFSLPIDMDAFFGALRSLILNTKNEKDGKRQEELRSSLMGLLKRAVDVAGNLGWRGYAMMEDAVEADGVETMLSALDFFGHDNLMSDKICSILRVLLQSDEGRFRMNRVKSACAILDGIVNSNEHAGVTLSA